MASAWRVGSIPPSAGPVHHRQIIRIAFGFEAEAEAVWHLLDKYGDVPIDFADASLVRMAEIHAASRVWTVDSDFKVYRRNVRQSISLIFPA